AARGTTSCATRSGPKSRPTVRPEESASILAPTRQQCNGGGGDNHRRRFGNGRLVVWRDGWETGEMRLGGTGTILKDPRVPQLRQDNALGRCQREHDRVFDQRAVARYASVARKRVVSGAGNSVIEAAEVQRGRVEVAARPENSEACGRDAAVFPLRDAAREC